MDGQNLYESRGGEGSGTQTSIDVVLEEVHGSLTVFAGRNWKLWQLQYFFSPYSQRSHSLKQNRQGFCPLRMEKLTAATLTRFSLSNSGGRTVLNIKNICFQ